MPRVQYEIGQTGTLEHYPREGVASSASVAAFSAGATPLFASEAVTLDTASQAVSNVSPGDRTVTVASTAGFVPGRRYWLADDGGRGYEVRLVGKSATVLTLDQPARFAITAGTIKGHGLRRTLTETGSVYRRVRVVWSYTVDGVAHRQVDFVDIVRMPFDLHLTEEDIEQADPTFGEVIGQYKGWEKVRDRAIRDVWNFLIGIQVEPDLCRERELLRDAAVYRTLQLLNVRTQGSGQTDQFTRWGKLYDDTLKRFESGHHWYDSDDDLTVGGSGDRTVNDPGELHNRRSETTGIDAYQLRTG